MQINPLGALAPTATGSTTSSGSLGKDDFLKILVAQLQNQDPTQPMNDTEFISQMAQFSTLEQMQQMTTMFSYTQAYSLVGRNITAVFTDDAGVEQEVTANVDSVITYNGAPYLSVGGYVLPLSTPMSVNSAQSSSALLEGAALIGRVVTYADADGVAQNGLVTRAEVVDGAVMLTVGGIQVNLQNVTAIADASTEAVG